VLQLYNTLTRSIEKFQPWEPRIVKIYFCGPTVYDYSHLGHARAYVAIDIIKRYLKFRGYDVIHVQNITDIDDKIIKRSQEEGRNWKEIADYYTKDYLEMIQKLNIHIDIHPRVTEHINDIIEFIERLIEKGHAYIAPSGSVYFDVTTYKDYGRLSGRLSMEEWRQEMEFLQEKKHPFDFALWKAAKPGEPYWKAPWGYGRPGWHIECSVMSSKYLGSKIDIHGGGQDLIFPHHENERAQSEAYFGKSPWVKYWLHVGLLTFEKEKMSKSLGNIIIVKEALKKWKPEAIRLWIFSAHYRSQLEFSERSIEQANTLYLRLVRALETLRNILREVEPTTRLDSKDIAILNEISDINRKFREAMDNDFNTPKAFSQVYRLTTLIFKDIETRPSHATALRAYITLKKFNEVLGVLDKHFERVREFEEDTTERLIDLIVKVRHELRLKKEYGLADWIRTQLSELGIRLMDSKEGTKWIIEK